MTPGSTSIAGDSSLAWLIKWKKVKKTGKISFGNQDVLSWKGKGS